MRATAVARAQEEAAASVRAVAESSMQIERLKAQLAEHGAARERAEEKAAEGARQLDEAHAQLQSNQQVRA